VIERSERTASSATDESPTPGNGSAVGEFVPGMPKPAYVASYKEWVESDDPALEGLAIYVRTNITNREQRELAEYHAWLAGDYQAQWDATPREERDYARSPRRLELEKLAPYIHEWNAYGEDPETGEYEKLPPPRVAGADVFECILDKQIDWCIRVVMHGYVITKKANGIDAT
jgi:hypothetical protein